MIRSSRLLMIALAAVLLPGCINSRHWPGSAGKPQPTSQPLATSAEGRSPEQVVVVRQPQDEPSPRLPATRSSNPPVEANVTPPSVPPGAVPVFAKSEPRPEEPLKPVPGPDPAGALAKVEHKPEELNRLLRILKAYQEDRPDEALQLIKQYPPKDQELLLALLPIIAQVERKGSWAERLDATQKLAVIETLRSLTGTLQQSAPLRIKKAEFARNVTAFGRYEPLPSPVFRPGDRVELYAEIENLNDQRLADGRYVVRLSSNLIIRENARQGLQRHVPSTLDWSRSERQDHHAVVRFTMDSKSLQPGVYTLEVHIVDVETRREAKTELNFRLTTQTAKVGE